MIKKIVKLFKSIKLAISVMLFISLLGLLSIFITQIPAEFSASQEGYNWWVSNVAVLKFGSFSPILKILGLFDIFHSLWFLGAVFLLLINILVCTLSRDKSLRSEAERAAIVKEKDFFEIGKAHGEITVRSRVESSVSMDSIYDIVSKSLEKRRYSILAEKSEKQIYMAGDRNRRSPYGTYAVHLSLFVFVFGILLGSLFGFQNDSFVVFEGTSRDVGFNTGLSLYLDSFTDDYWADGNPKDYRSAVTLFEGEQQIQTAEIRVNHPLIYKGVRFHQSYFGPAVKLSIAAIGKGLIYDDNIALAGMRTDNFIQRPAGEFGISDNGDSINLIGPSTSGVDPLIAGEQVGLELYDKSGSLVGWLKLDKNIPQEVGGYVFTLERNLQYSGFLVSKDPGIIFIWIASALFIFGLFVIFYFPRRQIWVAIDASSVDGCRIRARLGSRREFGLENELLAFISEWKKALQKEGLK